MRRALTFVAVVSAGLLLGVASRAGSATSAVTSASGAVALERSTALAEAPPPGRFATDVLVPAAAARAFADGLAEEVPLPEGGSIDGIQWEPAGGAFAPSEARMVLQYNAMCQWVRAYRDGRDVDVSGRVLADIPSWSAWREAETGLILRTAIDELVGGGGEASAVLLGECDRSHADEVRFTRARGLTPPR
jgi:hypothetical protein